MAHALASHRPREGNLRQVGKFAVAGALNTATDLVVFNVLAWALGLGAWRFAAWKIISFAVAATQSYFLNSRWVFPGRTSRVGREASLFGIVTVTAALVNTAAAWSAYRLMGLAGFEGGIFPTLAALVGSAAAFAWNFVGYKFVVFVKR